MKQFFNISSLSLLASLFLFFLSLIISLSDSSFYYRWLTFSIWILSIVIPFLSLLIKKYQNGKKQINQTLNSKKNDLIPFGIITFLAIFLSLFLLTKYPFVSVYDEVRDGGLHAKQITDGTIKNIFSYGRYESHGLTIPVITSFFYRIFQNSILTFRLPAAIVSILEIILLYFLIKKIINKETAFWSALALATIPLHLFYARTEIVVIFSSILTTISLLGLSYFIKPQKYYAFALLGLFLGFASGFHTSARTVALLTVLVVSLITIYNFYFKNYKINVILGISTLIIFYFIGLGPRILYTTPDIFFQTRSFSANENQKNTTNIFNKIANISINYKRSVLVYFKEPTISTHYPDFKPILNPVLGILFLIGFFYSLFSKNTFLKVVSFYALILPLTNSAVTEAINSDNRLAPLFPISAILTGAGIFIISSKLHTVLKFKIKYLLLPKIFLFIYILSLGFIFFQSESATRQHIPQDYLLMYTIYLLQSDSNYKNTNNMCFFMSPNNYNWLSPWYNLLKTDEQFQYFLPDKYIYVLQNNSTTDNQIFVSRSCNQTLEKENFNKTTFCSVYKKFECPPTNKEATIEVYLENSPNAVFPTLEELKLITPAPLLIDPKPQFIP